MKTTLLFLISFIYWHDRPAKYTPRRCIDGITISVQSGKEIIEELCESHGVCFTADLGHVLFLLERAKYYGIPERIAIRWIYKESRFDSCAVSYKGAFGYTQIMPGTWNELSCQLGFSEFTAKNNIEAGMYYLSQQYKRFGTWELALAAYNSGPARVASLGRIPKIKETQKYVKFIMK